MSFANTRPAAPFIVGASRSGTTMVRLMLDAHPEMAIPPETHFIKELHGVWKRSGDPAEVLDALVAHPRFAALDVDSAELRAVVDADPAVDFGGLLRAMFRAYARGQGKSRWGDKTPRYVLDMPLIAALLPEARFVHMVRDGRDVAASVIPLPFGPSDIEEAARWWVERIHIGRRDGAGLAYRELRYEAIAADPEAELRALDAWLGLSYDPAQLEYYLRAEERVAGTWMTDAAAKLDAAPGGSNLRGKLGQPPHTRSIGRWRSDLSAEDVRTFEAIAGDTLEELGYAPATSRPRK